ncbi:MAG: hypothetical protein ACW99G_03090 [Candidatus Thorarchaeota archaeon]|jgi:hypothetical protein
MALSKFVDWLNQQDESSAFTRLRRDAALGLKPPIAAASIHSHSTAHPFEVDKLDDMSSDNVPKKKKKKKKKKKSKKKNEWASWLEAKLEPKKNQQVDGWLSKIGQLKDDVEKSKEKKKDDDLKGKVEKDDENVDKDEENVDKDAENLEKDDEKDTEKDE